MNGRPRRGSGPTLAALVLAAGSARRFGADKLSAMFLGEPLLRHAVRAARAAPVERVLVVARAGLDPGHWPGDPPVDRIDVVSDALSASLRTGVAALAGDEAPPDGAFVFLGDMPLVPPALAGTLAPLLGAAYAVVPRHRGRPGHPVLLSARAFADVALLKGDRGAGMLLADRPDVRWVDCADEAILLDVDSRDELAALERRAGG